MNRGRWIGVGLASLIPLVFPTARAQDPTPDVVVLNDDGGWCWFEDERAVFDGDRLLVGSIASGHRDPSRRGGVEVVALNPETGRLDRATLHERFGLDDHNSPALWIRPDGRLLAVYARHGSENRVFSRVTRRPHDISDWEAERVIVPSPSSRVTYSNLLGLSAENDGRGRLFDFFRGLDNRFKPSWMTSDDLGQTWTTRGVVIDVPGPFRHRPYVKYASNGRDTIHLAFTEGHPRDFPNSIHHAFYRAGILHRSDGSPIGPLAEGPIVPEQATRVFSGDADHVAWIHDLQLDGAGRPCLVYSVQVGSANQPPGQGGNDHRYRYGSWDGSRWLDREIAFAGRRLYAGEDDYTGGIAIDPQDVGTVYISTSVDPTTGAPRAGGHYEIYRGTPEQPGGPYTWTALTRDSTVDNLRPIVPSRSHGPSAVLWLRGRYRAYTDYDLEVVGLVPRATRR
jgi:hypothetical protein